MVVYLNVMDVFNVLLYDGGFGLVEVVFMVVWVNCKLKLKKVLVLILVNLLYCEVIFNIVEN